LIGSHSPPPPLLPLVAFSGPSVTIPLLEQLHKEVAEAIVNAHQSNNIPLPMQQGSARASKRKKLGLKKVFTPKFIKRQMLSLQGCSTQQVCILYLDTNY
jgi:hypothetical protein